MAALRLPCSSTFAAVSRRAALSAPARAPAIGVTPSLSKRIPASARRFASYTSPGLALGASVAALSATPESTLATRAGQDTLAKQAPPESIVSFYQLGFGSVAGICVGIFIKKGLKAVAFVLGGVFVLMQYGASRSIINVDWRALGSRYEGAVDRAAGSGQGKIVSSRAAAIWNRFADFLTADFPPRATFLAGLALGLRLG